MKSQQCFHSGKNIETALKTVQISRGKSKNQFINPTKNIIVKQ